MADWLADIGRGQSLDQISGAYKAYTGMQDREYAIQGKQQEMAMNEIKLNQLRQQQMKEQEEEKRLNTMLPLSVVKSKMNPDPNHPVTKKMEEAARSWGFISPPATPGGEERISVKHMEMFGKKLQEDLDLQLNLTGMASDYARKNYEGLKAQLQQVMAGGPQSKIKPEELQQLQSQVQKAEQEYVASQNDLEAMTKRKYAKESMQSDDRERLIQERAKLTAEGTAQKIGMQNNARLSEIEAKYDRLFGQGKTGTEQKITVEGVKGQEARATKATVPGKAPSVAKPTYKSTGMIDEKTGLPVYFDPASKQYFTGENPDDLKVVPKPSGKANAAAQLGKVLQEARGGGGSGVKAPTGGGQSQDAFTGAAKFLMSSKNEQELSEKILDLKKKGWTAPQVKKALSLIQQGM